jgi:hypothetical protein
MEFKTRKAANSKKKNRAPEGIKSDDAPPIQPSPTHEEVKYRAYEIYLSRGATDGHDLEDWLQAERDLSQAPAGVQA